MARIAIGGFQHETNTFAPSRADYAQFEAGGGWPGAKYGEPIFGAIEGAVVRPGGRERIGLVLHAADCDACHGLIP